MKSRPVQAIVLLFMLTAAVGVSTFYAPMFLPGNQPAPHKDAGSSREAPVKVYTGIDAVRTGMRVISKRWYPLGSVYRVKRDSAGRITEIGVRSYGAQIRGKRIVSRYEIARVSFNVKLKLTRGEFRNRIRIDK